MSPSPPQPATAESGYITQPVPLENTYTTDTSLQRALKWYLPEATLRSVEPHFTQLGAEAISERVRRWSADAERNQPYVKSHNVWGQRYDYDRLVTTEGWEQLGKWGARHKIVSAGYDSALGLERRTVQYALGLISETDDHWTSGQWMTERAGGSDVHNTETWATYSPLPKPSASDSLGDGDYLINGFKFFSSATDANVALVLAKTPSGKLSTFLAPLRRTIVGSDGVSREISNGVRIHRLKNKLGTKELPTAELELKDMRAHLVGEVDQGVVTIAPLLNVTRIHTFIGSLSGWRRALSIAKSFAKARTTVGEPLWLIPMHLRLLADLEVKHRGGMNLGFFTVAVMSLVENRVTQPSVHTHLPRPGREANVVFRTLTATAKAVISKMAILGIQECQEAMGGVGYMDEADEPEFNISRILRNTSVNSIWEGTTNVLASEMVRFLLKADNMQVFVGWMNRTLALIRTATLRNALSAMWSALRARFSPRTNRLQPFLPMHADPVSMEIARRWILSAEGGVGDMVFHDIVTVQKNASHEDGENHLQWDCRIAWGMELPTNRASGHRSMQSASSKL
ncbi:uncharacterized protein N7482_008038 [Penicillium canariense]|uniref:Uncharacterized protein n=1 Tax=Penicillium canariense TaxID=189055 RepID=A0A9W9HSD3_9EURO|nr:uncharacterized protein N7482_008038 [Penicillium canariense]KAJ5156938.1 hypothetical protein N7482_008038 [Penicillium canariense]